MSVLRAILELQGSLDTATVRTGDRRVAEIADRFLPGCSANPEWYRELLAFVLPGVPQVDADPARAIRELIDAPGTPRPTAPQASRLMYALGAVTHLIANVPDGVTLPFVDPTIPRWRNLLAELLPLLAPDNRDPDPGSSSGTSDRPAPPAARGDAAFEADTTFEAEIEVEAVIALFANQFTRWQDWYEVAQALVALGVLSADAAAVPLCLPTVVTIDGRAAIVVDTEFTSHDVSLNQVKAVADPRNWGGNYPAFFCHMDYRNLRTDGWRRVLETVGICAFLPPVGIRLRTMLKSYKTTVDPPGNPSARLDYDLNDPVPDPFGDGQITIDRGYINMRAPEGDPDQPPVQLRTRKVVRIEGIRPYVQARFVCIFGYAHAAMEMLLGAAKRPTTQGEYRYPWLDTPEIPGTAGPSASAPHPEHSAASTVITMTAECVQEMSTAQLAVTDKWMNGQLTLADLAQYSAEVGARLAGEPWRILLALSKPKGGAK